MGQRSGIWCSGSCIADAEQRGQLSNWTCIARLCVLRCRVSVSLCTLQSKVLRPSGFLALFILRRLPSSHAYLTLAFQTVSS